MDNTIISTARELTKTLLEGGHHLPSLQMENSPFSKLYGHRSDTSRLSSTECQLLRQSVWFTQWQTQLLREDFNTVSARNFVRGFVSQLLTLKRRQQDHAICGESIVESHGLMDFTHHHTRQPGHWVLHQTLEGQCLMKAEQTHVIGPGQLVLLGPDLDCHYQRAPNCKRWVHRWLRIPIAPEWAAQRAVLRQPQRLLQVEPSTVLHDSLLHAWQDLFTLAEHNQPPSLLRNRFEYFLLLFEQQTSASTSTLDHRIQAALSWMSQHYHEQWPLSDLAARSHLSLPRFSALFRQQLGVTPLIWRDQLRLAEARQLLLETTQPIGQIGRQVGYDDQLHFSRRFRQLVGMSPREFRRQRQLQPE